MRLSIKKTVGCVSLLALSACAAARGGAADEDGGVGVGHDSGVMGVHDAGGFGDGAATGSDAGVLPSEASADPFVTCFDGVDNDRNGATDCDDTSCQGRFAACCVGEVNDVCCGTFASARTVDFGMCPGADTMSCLMAGDQLIGTSSAPSSGALAMFGDASHDAGFVLAQSYDLQTSRLRLSAHLVAARACDGCFAASAFGLVASTTMTSPSVEPLIGVVLSGSANDIRIVSSADVLTGMTLPVPAVSSDPLDVTVTLVVADGVITVDAAAGADMTAVHLSASVPSTVPSAYVAGWGRGPNPEGAIGAIPSTISHLTIETSGCDSPTAWSSPHVVAPAQDGTDRLLPTNVDVHGPSAATATTTTGPAVIVAYETDGEIRLAELDDHQVLQTEPSDATELHPLALLSPVSSETGRTTYADPELVDATSGWYLFATKIVDGVNAGIIRTFCGTGGKPIACDSMTTIVVVPPTGIPLPGIPPMTPPDIVAVDGPSVVQTASEWMMVIRETLSTSTTHNTQIALLNSTDGVHWTANSEASDLAGAEAARTSDSADEVADPDLVASEYGVMVLYAGRRGTRWSILERDGPDPQHLRPPVTVLSATGMVMDAAMLGVRAPSAIRLEPSTLALFVQSDDGMRFRIERALRATH